MTSRIHSLSAALLALALGAAQAGATTYTVPLQFNLTLAAPVCTLTVGGVVANATTPTPATGVTVDLTPTPLAVIASPNAIVNNIPNTTAFSAANAGLYYSSMYSVVRRLNSPPTATANCTTGTPMTVRLSKNSSATNASPNTLLFMAGSPGAGQSGTLPIGMLMGVASFGSTAGTTGSAGTTTSTNQPSVTETADGTDQAIALTAALYANSTTALTTSSAGLWTYSFNVNLDF